MKNIFTNTDAQSLSWFNSWCKLMTDDVTRKILEFMQFENGNKSQQSSVDDFEIQFSTNSCLKLLRHW